MMLKRFSLGLLWLLLFATASGACVASVPAAPDSATKNAPPPISFRRQPIKFEYPKRPAATGSATQAVAEHLSISTVLAYCSRPQESAEIQSAGWLRASGLQYSRGYAYEGNCSKPRVILELFFHEARWLTSEESAQQLQPNVKPRDKLHTPLQDRVERLIRKGDSTETTPSSWSCQVGVATTFATAMALRVAVSDQIQAVELDTVDDGLITAPMFAEALESNREEQSKRPKAIEALNAVRR